MASGRLIQKRKAFVQPTLGGFTSKRPQDATLDLLEIINSFGKLRRRHREIGARGAQALNIDHREDPLRFGSGIL